MQAIVSGDRERLFQGRACGGWNRGRHVSADPKLRVPSVFTPPVTPQMLIQHSNSPPSPAFSVTYFLSPRKFGPSIQSPASHRFGGLSRSLSPCDAIPRFERLPTQDVEEYQLQASCRGANSIINLRNLAGPTTITKPLSVRWRGDSTFHRGCYQMGSSFGKSEI